MQAGVNQGLTEVLIQTGTPDPTAIQSTVEARIEATLTAIADAPDTSTVGNDTSTDSDDPLLNIVNAILYPFRTMWNFAGLGGIWIQIICCIAPVLLLIIGIAND